ncbi:MAG: flippase [Candidatus Diapherotrites archaeon]|nr:flippase [Candidatus Diapherotrites archaeon]
MQDLKLIAKGAGFVFLGFAVSKVLSYFYRVIIARFLGPGDFGLFSIGLAVVGIVTAFGALGLYQGVLYFVAVFESQGKKENVLGTILGSLKLQLFSSVLFALALLILAEPIALIVFNQPGLTIVLQLLALTIPFQVITSNMMILAQAFKKIEYKVLLRNIIESIAKLVLTFLLLFFGFGVAGASLALALSSAFALAVSIWLIQKRVYRIFASSVKPVYNFWQLFSYSWPLFATGFFMMIMSNIDTICLGILDTAYNTGIYNVATPTARILELPSFALMSLFLPVATGLYVTKRMRELDKTYKTVVRWVFTLTFPCALFAIIFSREILSILFGPLYGLGASALSILALGFFTYSLMDASRCMLQPIAKTKLILFNTIVGATANVILNFLLIPPLGIIGAALATAFGYSLWSTLALWEVYAAIKIHPFDKAYWKPTIATLAITALFFALKSSVQPIDSMLFPISLLLLLSFGVAFLAGFALILLLIKGLQREDVEIMKALENKTGFKVKFVRNMVKRFI